jgi:hypothetical protein
MVGQARRDRASIITRVRGMANNAVRKRRISSVKRNNESKDWKPRFKSEAAKTKSRHISLGQCLWNFFDYYWYLCADRLPRVRPCTPYLCNVPLLFMRFILHTTTWYAQNNKLVTLSFCVSQPGKTSELQGNGRHKSACISTFLVNVYLTSLFGLVIKTNHSHINQQLLCSYW